MDTVPILPLEPFKDALAVSIVLVSLPHPLSLLALALYILFSSSKQVLSKLFTRLRTQVQPSTINNTSSNTATAAAASTTTSPSNTTTSTTTTTSSSSSSNNNTSQSNTTDSLISPSIILLFDICLTALLKSTAPNITKLVFVLSKSIIATNLCGNKLHISLLTCLTILILDHFFKILVLFLDSNYDLSISLNPYLFPYISNNNSNNNNYNNLSFFTSSSSSSSSSQSKQKLIPLMILNLPNYLINYFNLLLSIHIILMALSSIFRKNLLAKSINQFTNELNNHTTNTIQTSSNNSLSIHEIKVPKDLSNLPLELDEVLESENDQTPASFPNNNNNSNTVGSTNNKNTKQQESISTWAIVAENFETFVNSSFSKPKNSVKSIQPIWSLLATAKSMSERKDIYSGELEIDQQNSLITSDFINKYDEYKFENFDGDNNYKKILIFINYIGETLISFQLKHYNHGSIIIRVNGVIWYQVSHGIFMNESYFIVGGLTPNSQYDIQFIIEDEDNQGFIKKWIIDDLIVSTVDFKKNLNEGNVNGVGSGYSGGITGGGLNNGRVSSPLITLQESLITTNDNLQKEKVKLKKTRKEISKKINSYRSDIETLKLKISNSDKNDEKNWKKVLSLRNSVKQVEEDFSKIESKQTELESKELEINEIYLVEKRKFETIQRNFNNFKNQFNDSLNLKKQSLTQLNLEIESLLTKHEKLSNKLEKLEKEHLQIQQSFNAIFNNDYNKRLEKRSARFDKRQSLLQEFKKEINHIQEVVLKLTKENESLRASTSN